MSAALYWVKDFVGENSRLLVAGCIFFNAENPTTNSRKGEGKC